MENGLGMSGSMNLDINTLFQVTIYVEAILGLLLLFVWVQNTQLRAVLWWGFAHLMRAGSIYLFGMYGAAPDFISIDLANAFLFTAFAMTWMGARVFDGRSEEPVYLVTGAVLWLLVCRLPAMEGAIEIRVLVSSGIITTYTWLAAYEFWQGRTEPLVSRWPAIFMLFAHGALFLLRTPLLSTMPVVQSSHLNDSVWMTVLSFEALLFTISIAFILLAMAKERTEHRHKTAAMVDPLTGMPNRRSFLQDAALFAKRHRATPKPAAVLLVDLDHFKSINDRYGHALGDRVLEVFADTARGHVRPGDLFARLGGEEFAMALYDLASPAAVEFAEKLRAAFEEAAKEVDTRPVNATLSIGLVVCDSPVFDISSLLAQADQALYFAKERGRNRVEVASLNLVLDRAAQGATPTPVVAAPLAAQSAA